MKLVSLFKDSRERVLNDYVFLMLYEMNQRQVEETILLPALREALKKRLEAVQYAAQLEGKTKRQKDILVGCWSYLLNQYPEIEFKQCKDRDCSFVLEPKSVFVKFMLHNTEADRSRSLVKHSIFHVDLDGNAFPVDESVTEEIYYILPETDGSQLWGSKRDREFLIRHTDAGGEKQEAHREMRIDVECLLRTASISQATISYMEDKDFP